MRSRGRLAITGRGGDERECEPATIRRLRDGRDGDGDELYVCTFVSGDADDQSEAG